MLLYLSEVFDLCSTKTTRDNKGTPSSNSRFFGVMNHSINLLLKLLLPKQTINGTQFHVLLHKAPPYYSFSVSYRTATYN